MIQKKSFIFISCGDFEGICYYSIIRPILKYIPFFKEFSKKGVLPGVVEWPQKMSILKVFPNLWNLRICYLPQKKGLCRCN